MNATVIVDERPGPNRREVAPGLMDREPEVVDHLGRSRRFATVTGLVLAYVAVGIALNLNPVAYLLIGIAFTYGFQRWIAHEPVRQLWLADGRPFRVERAGVALALGLAIVPSYLALVSIAVGDLWNVVYELAALAGIVPAVYALRAMDGAALRQLVRSLLTAGLVGSGLFVLIGIAIHGVAAFADPLGMARTMGVSFLQYVPVVFVIEEVLFRGALDPYARGRYDRWPRSSAVLVSALWGLWHLPITFATTGFAQLPVLLLIHTVLGLLLTGPWRRSGNLAVPGLTHAITDAIRNAFVAI